MSAVIKTDIDRMIAESGEYRLAGTVLPSASAIARIWCSVFRFNTDTQTLPRT